MLGLLVYGVIFACIAFALGLFAYKLWDRGQSQRACGPISNPDWIKKISRNTADPKIFSQQELYDFSAQYITALKGVFASPTPAKLNRLNEVLAAPQNLHEQLWQDMSFRLVETHNSYGAEYIALLEVLMKHSEDTTQHYAAYRLANSLPYPPAKIRRMAEAFNTSPHIAPARKVAAQLR